MINFLHNFNPDPILLSFGTINVYWYGLFLVLGILVGTFITIYIGKFYGVKKETIIDLSFWLILAGILGARVYDVFLELPFYIENPQNILKIWEGGLAIHGAIIAGLIVIYIVSKKLNLNFWKITAISVPGLALAQAIGRWGNYFNNELFGLPTNMPWGIPINILSRPLEYISSEFFHPTFLYESLGNLLIFLILIGLHVIIIKGRDIKTFYFFTITMTYLVLYSILRFSLEFIRIDYAPTILNLRWPQVMSLLIILLVIILVVIKKKNEKK